MSRNSLLSLFADLYEPRNLSGASASCKAQYRSNIRKFGRFLGHDAMPDDLTDDNLAKFIQSIRADGRSPATANKIRAQIIALWNFLARKRIVETYPDVQPLREFKRIPVAWNDEQLCTLFKHVQTLGGFVDCIPAADWWTALHGVLWDTGLRIGAALQLRWEHLDLLEGILLVSAETQKQGADQQFYLGPDTLAWLRRIAPPPERQLIFPWSRSIFSLWNHYARILRDAGLPADRRSKFHRMRRSHASHLKRAGGDPTATLGHSSQAMTARHYLDPRITGADNAAQKLRRFGGG